MPPYRVTAAELERARNRLGMNTPYERPPLPFYNEDDDFSHWIGNERLGIRTNVEHQAELQADAREETMLWRAEEEREAADLRRHAAYAATFYELPPPPLDGPFGHLPRDPFMSMIKHHAKRVMRDIKNVKHNLRSARDHELDYHFDSDTEEDLPQTPRDFDAYFEHLDVLRTDLKATRELRAAIESNSVMGEDALRIGHRIRRAVERRYNL
jgi:hypothetical protein